MAEAAGREASLPAYKHAHFVHDGTSTSSYCQDHYPAFFIITAPQLANYSTHPAWTADLSKPWKEFKWVAVVAGGGGTACATLPHLSLPHGC